MTGNRAQFLFLNVGHGYAHLFMLLFPTVVLSLEKEFQRPYVELLPLAIGGFIAFGAGAIPAGWLGDRWSRKHMMTVFFIGIGSSSIVTGLAGSTLGIAVGLGLIGLFGSIYHPVGVAMVVQNVTAVGRKLGINGVFGNLGVAGAALIAGGLTDLISWRAAFILPGIVAVATGVAFALYRLPAVDGGGRKKSPATITRSPQSMMLVFGILVVITLCSGTIFHTTLVALPKVFAVRLAEFATSTFGIGALISIVYTFGALAQILVGVLLDRFPLKRILIGVATVQVVFLLATAEATNISLLIFSFFMVFSIFGAIPIQDTIVARYATEEWRSRVYGVKYVISLGIGAIAIPLVSLVYGATQDFVYLFGLFAFLASILIVAGSFMPREEAVSPGVPAASLAGGAEGNAP